MKEKKDSIYNLYFADEDCTIPCTIHFSRRKSISIQIKEDATVHVRVPFYTSISSAQRFIEEKREWIRANHEKVLSRLADNAERALSPAEQKQAEILKKRFLNAAKAYFPRRCAELQQLTGGYYAKISIRNQKTRWGSCSQTGTLSFNYRLMMAPPAVIDYVIVHELCHLTHMNHSDAFWKKVAGVMPDYAVHRRWLREHGHELTEAHYLLSLM